MSAARTAARTRRGALAAMLGLLAIALMAVPEASAAPVISGQLDWGIKGSFRTYITGPIADGEVVTTGGASASASSFRFPAAGGDYDPAAGSGSITFDGSVTFRGHNYGNGAILDVTVSALRLDISGGSGALYGTLRSRPLEDLDPEAEPIPFETYSNVMIASVSLGAAGGAGTTVTWTGAGATLASSGAPAFGNFYSAGEALDPLNVSLTLGPAGSEPPPPPPAPGAGNPSAPASGMGLAAGDDGGVSAWPMLPAIVALAAGGTLVLARRRLP